MELLLITFIAFFIAVLFSMLGLGGAIIYTPLFFWLGLPLLTAISMALLLNTITTASASITYLKLRLVDTRIAIPIILTAIPGALTGSYLAPHVDTKILIILISAILFFASMRIIFFNNICFLANVAENKKMMIGAVMSYLIGTVSSLVGIGGGTFIVPLLLFFGFKTKNAVGTSSFIITFMSFSGFLGHMSFGSQKQDLSMLLYAGAAAFIGAQAGSRVIFKRMSSRKIELLFAIILLFVAGKLLYGLL